MKPLVLIVSAAILIGCATDASRIVEYRYVAYSWTDGNINDMIEAWGNPKGAYEKATEEEPGIAQWRVFSRIGAGANTGAGAGYRYFCDTVAKFGMDGTITEIKIRHSDSCHRYYKDLESMLRPGVRPLPTDAG